MNKASRVSIFNVRNLIMIEQVDIKASDYIPADQQVIKQFSGQIFGCKS